MWRFALGSESSHKIEALREACRRLQMEVEIVSRETASGVRKQPVGLAEISRGARNRALGAARAYPNHIGVGIESGILDLDFDAGPVDVAIIALRHLDGTYSGAISSGVELPIECSWAAAERGLHSTTVSSVVAERYGGDATDPHSTLTGGRVSRQETLVQGLVNALASLLARAERG